MYKMIATDMDGTLLTNSGEIANKTIEYINQAKKKGVIHVIASGRSPAGLDVYKKILGCDTPIIAYNGAYAKAKGKVIFERELSKKDAKHVLELGKKYDATMCIWSNNQLYVNKKNEKAQKYAQLTFTDGIYVTDYSKLLDMGITKILWYEDIEKIAKIKSEITPGEFESATYLTSTPVFLEFFNAQSSKGRALIELGKMYNIEPSEIIAVGDAENDLSMIISAGLGVAMENADEAVKEAADYTTLSNENCGVAHIIEKFIL